MADFDLKELIAKVHNNYIGPYPPGWYSDERNTADIR